MDNQDKNTDLSYKALLEQRQALELKIAEARVKEMASALEEVRKIIVDFDLTVDDVFGRGKSPSRSVNTGARATVAPKYRNPETGETWTGRGKPPRWIADQDREKFLIEQPTAA